MKRFGMLATALIMVAALVLPVSANKTEPDMSNDILFIAPAPTMPPLISPGPVVIAPAPTAPAPTYLVVEGDCLWSIAREQLGSGSRWEDIYQLNQDVIADPTLIFPGQQLKLPA